MKRSIFALAMIAMAGSAWAAPHRIGGATATLLSGSPQFPGGLAQSLPPFLAGNTAEGFLKSRNGFSGFVVQLTAGTRLAPIGSANEQYFNKSYDALLPLYIVIDKPATRIAAPADPITQPLADKVVVAAGKLSNALKQ